MAHIAIDIVLRLPQKLEDEIIAVNNTYFETGKTKIKLGKIDYIPHISLLMGVIDEKHIGDVAKRMQEISGQFDAIKLHITNFENNSIQIARDTKIQEIHETILEHIGPFLVETEVRDDFFVPNTSGNKIEEGFKNYVASFIDDASLENFDPHITTHVEVPEKNQLPKQFTSTTLGLYQLGDYGTIRKELFLTQL